MPFVDLINTMLDESLPLTTQEFLEWGNPKQPAAGRYMSEYSPYDNLARTAYPAILVTTSLNDSQVLYHEPTKYVARLRTLKTDKNPLILKCEHWTPATAEPAAATKPCTKKPTSWRSS